MSANPPSFSRRAALRLLGAALLATAAGCRPSKKSGGADMSSSGTGPTAGRTSATPVPPSKVLASRVADDERKLLATYDAAIADQPELKATLEPLRADHAAHLLALTPGVPTNPASPQPTSATPTPSVGNLSAQNPSAANASNGAPTSLAPPKRAETLAALASRERAAAAARVNDLMTTDDGSLARLLASIGGCEAAHASSLAAAS